MRVPFKIHPRAFKALGADLVTNDIVAVIELVKNAYDAYATSVTVAFGEDGSGAFLEIEDNGTGMDRSVVEDTWLTVATPYRLENPYAKKAGKPRRRASGEKGLGRLSAARLGDAFEMVTQTQEGDCWRVQVNWKELADAEDLTKCTATISRATAPRIESSGTIIRISALRSTWDPAQVEDLRDNLARLLPPFEPATDFEIKLSVEGEQEPVEVSRPEFLKHPKYSIVGNVDREGDIDYRYKYSDIIGDRKRGKSGKLKWAQVREHSEDPLLEDVEGPNCGPFSFEIRAWDIGAQDTAEVAERFGLKKSTIRRDIRAYKGISIYRDGVLVLPKSETARDWLGLDLRRVGRVGHRLSTTQIVGNVTITARENARIEDTSDRERLAANPEVAAFEAYLRTIVAALENEREKDRRAGEKERPLKDLFGRLSAKELVESVDEVARDGGSAAEALPLVREFSDDLEKARKEIETRFTYYSRLATVGTIAQMLVHEVRNRTTVLAHALAKIAEALGRAGVDSAVMARAQSAREAVASLDRLADTFAPLATRTFKRRVKHSIVEESAARVAALMERELAARRIEVRLPRDGSSVVAVDPGELDAIMLNLLSNAAYWVGQAPEGQRTIQIRSMAMSDVPRFRVEVHDSGPGVPEEDAERIFLPGVTNKPGGIGMGLTVASELVAEYGGRLGLVRPGKLGGASFVFDVPRKGE